MNKTILFPTILIRVLVLLTTTAASQHLLAQHKKSGDTLILHKVKYPNGRLSAYSWMLGSTGNGRAICWDPKGAVMFDSEISRNHGHHSVQFDHHANKVVSRIEESSAPDAGIQWYRSTYYYDEKGVKTGEHHTSHDDMHHITRPGEVEIPVQHVVVPPPVVYTNEIWFINQTEFTLIASYQVQNNIQTDTLRSGDTLQLGNLTQINRFENPTKTAIFNAKPLKNTKRSAKWNFVFQSCGEQQSDETRKRYYYVIGQQLAAKNRK